MAPDTIASAKVLFYTIIDSKHIHTGNTRHYVGDKLLEPVYGLAICQYAGDSGFYLFYCNHEWIEFTDTWHQTIEAAKKQAEFEYTGVRDTWIEK